MYLAWRYGGADPYRLYNSLDEDYRPLDGDACEACEGLGWTLVRRWVDIAGEPTIEPREVDCETCGGTGIVVGKPRRPLFPKRVQAFVYACGLIADAEVKAMAGIKSSRGR